MAPTERGQPPVSFTIDGVEYSTEDRRQTAADLLRLGGVDPADHDLARVLGHGQAEQLADDDEVQIPSGAKFISIFTGPTPVA